MSTTSKKKPATNKPHPFLVFLLESGRQWQNKFADTARQTGSRPGQKVEVELSLVEFYQSEVFRYATRLADLPEQLRVIANFMVHRPKGRALKRLRIRRAEYVAYHYRNFVVLLQTATDIAIRLTGVTLALGLRPQEMNEKTVVGNEWTNRFRLKAPLERLQKVASPLKRIRNEWIHAGVTPLIEPTDTIALIESAQHLSGEEIWLAEWEIDAYFDKACDDLVKQIAEHATALHEAVDVLLTALQTPYKYWSSRLEHDWRITAEGTSAKEKA
ncbi:hypothetical protein LXT21_15185 [Myxococcus sp. K38C18041901]|uniref:hypothetical protein n=1 Tax=Myxococcus guangdongensis TaxID=2906760 RepID=UPI0020A7EBC9|nr:hypothetical protein [Myxococcus guangdongensis]MCP3060126.1 hypothetical protein [Myxococcus guangdongensis]